MKKSNKIIFSLYLHDVYIFNFGWESVQSDGTKSIDNILWLDDHWLISNNLWKLAKSTFFSLGSKNLNDSRGGGGGKVTFRGSPFGTTKKTSSFFLLFFLKKKMRGGFIKNHIHKKTWGGFNPPPPPPRCVRACTRPIYLPLYLPLEYFNRGRGKSRTAQLRIFQLYMYVITKNNGLCRLVHCWKLICRDSLHDVRGNYYCNDLL